jgi:4-hydroxy-2-oxoheptanedioate aldolase
MRSRQPNRLREIIRQGDIALGTCLYSFSPALIELAGFCGLDFCRIDNEHAWRQDQSTEDVLRGGLLGGLVPLLRVDRDNPYLIRKALEAGAGGVIIPHAKGKEDVQRMVEAAKFHPLGKRGYGGLCLSGKWGVDAGEEWMNWSNREQLVIPMVEDVGALEEIDEIMATEGVDGIFFGPADFSISAGVPLKIWHDKVVGAVKTIVETADKYEKFVIYPIGFPQWEQVERIKELGVHAVELGHDVSILKSVWQKSIGSFRSSH